MRAQILSFLALSSMGCATIVTGTNDTVRFVSNPPGATIEIQGKVAKAPVELVLSRSYFGAAEGQATLAGHLPRQFQIPREFNLWTIGNVVTLFLGVYVDVLTGALTTFPDTYEFQMYPKEEEE